MPRKILAIIWLSAVSIIALLGLKKIFLQSIGIPNGDAELVYLPGARKILADPLGFMASDILSYSVAPLGYIWPALWGADDFTTRLANCVLYLVCLYLVWRIASRLGGVIAGMAASLLWATTHTLLHAIPLVLTEAVFLFGFMLFIFGSVEAIASGNPKIRWFAAASAGLAITLLSRPVLQYIILGVLVLLLAGSTVLRSRAGGAACANVRLIWRRSTCAVILALVLPLAVVIKNGVYFGNWALGTGAGAGLYYGVHPLHLGEEPYYTNFLYDVGHTASTINPQTRGNLEVSADKWQKQIAWHFIAQTTWRDNIRFFAAKARSWLIYSPVERHFGGHWRNRRLALAMLILAASAALTLLWMKRGRNAVIQAFELLKPPGEPTGSASDAPSGLVTAADARGMAFCYAALLLLVLAMVVQFLPILYNGRYNGAFLDPLFIILGSVSLGLLTRHVSIPYRKAGAPVSIDKKWLLAGLQVLVLALLVCGYYALGKSLARHERLTLDPHRLGPAEVVLDSDAFGTPATEGMAEDGPYAWRTTAWNTRLAVPLTIPEGKDLERVYEAVWRLRLQVQGSVPASCRSVPASYSHPAHASSPLPPEIFLARDGEMRTYAVSAGFGMRPKADGALILNFSCPIGTRVVWGGAELLRSTIAEASREFILFGQPFSPYQEHDPRLPRPIP